MKRTFLLTALAAAGTLAAQDTPRQNLPVVTSPAFGLFRTLDADSNRALSAKEWSLFLKATDFAKADKDKDGQVSVFEWRDFIRPSGGRRPGGDRPGGDRPGGDRPGGDRPGGDRPGGGGPAVGQLAPAVKLKGLNDNREMDLSKVKRHTVLVFGSYT